MMARHNDSIGGFPVMRLSLLTEQVLPTEWTNALERIQRVLADALQSAEAQTAALDAQTAQQLPETPDFSVKLHTIDSDSPLTLEKELAQTEQALAAAQEALNQWLAKAEQVAQKLAEQAVRAV
jgi:hypothetical protein